MPEHFLVPTEVTTMVSIRVAGFENFFCPAGSRMDIVRAEIRQTYSLLNGTIILEGVAVYPDAALDPTKDYEFIGFKTKSQGKKIIPPIKMQLL